MQFVPVLQYLAPSFYISLNSDINFSTASGGKYLSSTGILHISYAQ